MVQKKKAIKNKNVFELRKMEIITETLLSLYNLTLLKTELSIIKNTIFFY